MRGGGDNVGVGNGTHVLAARDETGDVRHVDHQERAIAVRNLGKRFEIDGARIGRRARDDELRLMGADHVLDLVEIDAAGLRVDAVGEAVVDLAGQVDLGAVRQVAAVGQIHADDGVARLEHGHIGREVGLCAGVRLHVGVFCAEKLLGTVNGDLLDDVDHFAATVVALAGVALGIFVGQHAAHRRDDRRGGDVLRRDQLDVALLPLVFRLHLQCDLGVKLCQIVH